MDLEKELVQETPLILLNFHKLVSFCHYSGIVLGNAEKSFAIYGQLSMNDAFNNKDEIAKNIIRPKTYDLLGFLFSGFDIKVRQVIINDYKDNVFYTRLFLEQEREQGWVYIADIDARPSDSIPLALSSKAPIFCMKHVFDKAVPYED